MTTKRNHAEDDRIRVFVTIYTTIQALLLILFFGSAPFLNLKIATDESMGIVELILPLLTGSLGLVLGFYFGTQEEK
jgi:hypothetical protein